VCLGIHGQLDHANQATRTVEVKLSSWPSAQNTAYLVDTLRSARGCARPTAGSALRTPDVDISPLPG
jgi:hypothetical protein